LRRSNDHLAELLAAFDGDLVNHRGAHSVHVEKRGEVRQVVLIRGEVHD
jgi:hypothetical protein